MRKNFKAFTLVEMLIVMGIIIILMAVGIASGRYAIRRANKIEHQNAAEQIYQGLQAYYADNRQYPDAPGTGGVETLVTGDSYLGDYIDDFDGGSQATYFYNVDGTNQIIMVCVTHGGLLDENELGIYCTGNGIASGEVVPNVDEKDIEFGATDYAAALAAVDGSTAGNGVSSPWDPAAPWGTAE